MGNKLTWHGHANFEIATPKLNILIDPWFEGNPSAVSKSSSLSKVDLVLVTHDHGDHMGQAIEICKQTGAHLGAIVEVAKHCIAQGISQDKVLNGIGFNIGGSIDFNSVKITMVQAFHSCERGFPVGYIVTLEDGYTIYHAGDTAIFSSMELWGQLFDIDLALLPIGGVFTMDPRQAALACKLLKCKKVVPMHWGSFPVLEKDTKNFQAALKEYAPQTELLEMSPGQTVEL
ncbi:metal-dependent hydrolase [Desulfohalobiaceae bacterium Ax17]|jgi:L-ascorbate metabolism protein UlaG (beta-lactamase superfamily)|uniref:metal-dependent hydrolase n=1 Tax=Desulfovulcanus ferrireducens TaxID=2831190 RepID=UPI00207BC00A|nr:metal-dependent hydrolase [Desulfovulcanus ferrireducens]MBT8763917.1 metal-dependent hydrolase [Desulfovulcanus ferrireducens]